RWLMVFQAGDRLGDLRRVERKKWDKAPSTNIQAPEKLQEPSFKTRALRVWSLKFGTSLVLGAWMLVLFAPPYSTVFVEEPENVSDVLDGASAKADLARGGNRTFQILPRE